MTDLRGKDFIALRRLSDAHDRTLAEVGDTCERVPAAPGGTQAEALARLLASGKIAPVARESAAPSLPAPPVTAETEGE